MKPITARGQLLITRHRNVAVHDERALTRAVRTGEMRRLRSGVYVRSAAWRVLSPEDQQRLEIAAAFDAGREGLVFSHRSAAALWGVPSVQRHDGLVHARTTVAAGTRTEHGFRKHAVVDLDQHVVEHHGIAVTSLPRTIVDLALSEPFGPAVVAVDWALRDHTDRDTLLQTLEEAAPKQGRARAERAILFGDAASGSPGESRSRADMELGGLVMPTLQHPFEDDLGLVAYVDFFWPQFRIIGEFDGAVKYSDAGMLDGRQPYEVVLTEKRREDRLRALGFTVVRWMWDAFATRGRLVDRLLASGVRRR